MRPQSPQRPQSLQRPQSRQEVFTKNTENNRSQSRHTVSSKIQIFIPPMAQSTQDDDADTDAASVGQTQRSRTEGWRCLERRVGVLTKLGEVKRHADKLSKDEDSDVEWDDFALSEELSTNSDQNEEEVEEEDNRVIEHETAVAAMQETAVAARSETSVLLKPQAPPGMDVVNEQYAHSMRQGTDERHAMHSNPPAGPVDWEEYEHLPRSTNINNVVLAHVEVGMQAEFAEFAEWCNQSTNHIIVINLISKDRSCGTTMRRFLRQCQKLSMYQMLLYSKGRRRHARVLRNASKKCADPLSKAVDTTVAEKFVLYLFDDTVVMFHRYLISNVRWCELDGGKTAVAASAIPQFGSLSLFKRVAIRCPFMTHVFLAPSQRDSTFVVHVSKEGQD